MAESSANPFLIFDFVKRQDQAAKSSSVRVTTPTFAETQPGGRANESNDYPLAKLPTAMMRVTGFATP